MAEPTAHELHREIRSLQRRVQWLERLLFRGLAVLSAFGLAGALMLPFWQADNGRPDEPESLSLLLIPAALTNAGDGPYRAEAWLAGAAVWVLIAAIPACGGAVLAMTFNDLGPQVRRWHAVAIVAGAVGVAGVWLLTLMMAGRSDGELDVFSPGLLSLTFGVGLAIAVWRAITTHPIAG